MLSTIDLLARSGEQQGEGGITPLLGLHTVFSSQVILPSGTSDAVRGTGRLDSQRRHRENAVYMRLLPKTEEFYWTLSSFAD